MYTYISPQYFTFFFIPIQELEFTSNLLQKPQRTLTNKFLRYDEFLYQIPFRKNNFEKKN